MKAVKICHNEGGFDFLAAVSPRSGALISTWKKGKNNFNNWFGRNYTLICRPIVHKSYLVIIKVKRIKSFLLTIPMLSCIYSI